MNWAANRLRRFVSSSPSAFEVESTIAVTSPTGADVGRCAALHAYGLIFAAIGAALTVARDVA